MNPSLKSVVVVPHTHWDREWYEQEHLFRQRLVETVERVLNTLESVPDFPVFLLDGQTAIVDDYLSVRPGDEPRITALARAGKLLLGPWYVLADEFLVTDEALVRNLQLGALAGKRYGSWMPIGYCPDSFGHPANLPAILHGFGIERAILWRGYGGRAGETEDLFRWRGPSSPPGHSVLVAHLTPDGYELGAELPVGVELARARWRDLEAVLGSRTATGDVLLPNGADHHGIQPDVIEAVETLRGLATTVEFRIGTPSQYFDALPDVDGCTPLVEGDLRFSYGYTWTLQGIHSTRAHIKRRAAAAEHLLARWAEPQCSLAGLATGPSRRALLHDAWREFLRSCAHDSIGGCCTDRVANDVDHRFVRAASAAQRLFLDAIWDRMRQDKTYVRRHPKECTPRLAVVNPSPYTRVDVVEATVTFFRADVPVGKPVPQTNNLTPAGERQFHLVAPDGQSVPVQVTRAYLGYERLDSPRDYPDQDLVDAYRVFFVGRAPSLGITSYRIVDGPPPESDGADVVRATTVDVKLAVSNVEVTGGETAFDVTDGSARLCAVADLVSERDEGDTYTFQPVTDDVPMTAEWGPVRTIANGPVVGCIARDFRVGARVRGTVFARMQRGSGVIRWFVEGTNYCGNHRLRLLFPLPAGSPDCVFVDQHFGPIVRGRETSDPGDYPREHPVKTAPCHKYVSLGGSRGGLTVFPRGSFEYELTGDHVAVTLFRAVGDLSRGDLAARPGHAAWPVATPDAQELGPFRVETGMALLGVTDPGGAAAWDALERMAETFHAPLAGVMMRWLVAPPDEVEGPRLKGAGLVFKALHPAIDRDAVVLRCVNVTSSRTRGVVEWPMPLSRAVRCRLDEHVEHELALENGSRVTFDVAPREIVTLMFWVS